MSEYFPKLKSSGANVKVELNFLLIDVDKWKNVPTNLSYLRNNVDKLDIEKLETTSDYLSKLSNVVKNDVIKKS